MKKMHKNRFKRIAQRSLLLAALVFLIAACQPEGRVFVEHQKLSSDLEWMRVDTPAFDIPITQAGQVYDMKLTFRYATGYQYPIAKILVFETSPSGKERTYEYELTIRDDAGNYIGDPAGDIWDSEHLIGPGKVFEEPGTYHYKVTHNMPDEELHFAMELGIVLDEVGKNWMSK